MERKQIKPTLSVTLSPHLYQRLKNEIGSHKISQFVEKAIAKELGEHENDLAQQQLRFQQELVASYKRAAANKQLAKEEKIWEDITDEWLDHE